VRREILLIYPEGSRGNPESLTSFKSGIAHLAKRHPEIPIYPIFLHGLGKTLPKGEALLVPFFCDVWLGNPLHWTGNKQSFMDLLNQSIQELAAAGNFSAWQ
jgi:1-acyl-sn-glycerol-3-phosphate acyltransferase